MHARARTQAEPGLLSRALGKAGARTLSLSNLLDIGIKDIDELVLKEADAEAAALSGEARGAWWLCAHARAWACAAAGELMPEGAAGPQGTRQRMRASHVHPHQRVHTLPRARAAPWGPAWQT